MKICMLVYAFYESDTRVIQYAKALAQRGDSVDVIALRKETAPRFEILDGVNVHRIQRRRVNEKGQLAYLLRILLFLCRSAFVLTKKHSAKRYDVIHVHSVPDFLIFAAAIPKLFGARLILDIHDILPEFYASKFGATPSSAIFKSLVLIEKLSTAFSDHVIIANDLWRDRITARSVKPEKCSCFINYPDPAIFYQRSLGHTSGHFTIIYPGTLNSHQGLDVAIKAFATIAHQMPESQFHIYGEGPAKKTLIGLAEELGMSGHVVFHDFLPVATIAEIMAKADLGLVPKRASSGFGNEAASTKIMEFMALGIPVIASRTRIDTYYHDESRIKFVQSEDEVGLAQAILDLRNDANGRKRLALNGLRYVRDNNWAEKSQVYLRLIDDLVSRSASSPGRTISEKHPYHP